MKRGSLFLLALLSVLSAGAIAQGSPGVEGEGFGSEPSDARDSDTRAGGERNTVTFTELDQNNDGLLSEDEVSESTMSANFEEMDQDGDSEVNRNEYFQYHRDQ